MMHLKRLASGLTRHSVAPVFLLGLAAFVHACSPDTSATSPGGDAGVQEPADTGGGNDGGVDGGAGSCQPCVTSNDCAGGSCVQFAGDTYCAQGCATHTCPAGYTCSTATTESGAQVEACLPTTGTCGVTPADAGAPNDGGGSGGDDGTTHDGGDAGMCGSLAAPGTASCCRSCSGGTCQPNGCYGGWWCNTDNCKCQRAPGPGTCGGGADGGQPFDAGEFDAGAPYDAGPRPDGGYDIRGGKLPHLRFAVVGDTRPSTEDDTQGYPTAIITKIWQEVESFRTPFAITTGDYMFARSNGAQGSPQLDLYLQAQGGFHGLVLHAMGNHECTGATASNCGSGNRDGVTNNYTAFMTKLLGPHGLTNPYYSVRFDAEDGSWSAKIVVVAANAWDATQQQWLESELAPATTYTIVVRHEPSGAQAPGVAPSNAIVKNHPYTVVIVGHTHTLDWRTYDRELVVGNGGAPLSGSVNYGYVIAEQRTDGALEFTAYDYSTNAQVKRFALKPDGSATP